MNRHHLTSLGVAVALVAGMFFAAKPAVAQDQGQTYYTYVSEWAVPRAQWADFDKQDAASAGTMKNLVADGTIVDWGNMIIRVHQDDGFTHAEWFTATSRAALLKALEGQWATAANPAYSAATKHHDFFLHTLAHGGKTSAVTTGYIRVASYTAKPGQGEDLAATFTKYLKPMLDAAVNDGTLLAYNFDEEDIHTMAPGTYSLAMMFPNGEALDRFYAAVSAMEKDNPAAMEAFGALSESDAHRDIFGRITAYQHQ